MQLATRDRDLAEARTRNRRLEAALATATAAAAQTAASSGVSAGAHAASLTGGSEALAISVRASALLPMVSTSARAPEQLLLQEGVWRAALEYMRAECNSLRARLGDSRRNASLSLLERRPLPPTHALLSPALSSGTVSIRSGAGVSSDGALSSAIDAALGAASKALLDAGLVRTRRRIPLLRAGGNTGTSRGTGSASGQTTAVQHVLNEACRAAAAAIDVRHAEDRVFEARQQLQARVK